MADAKNSVAAATVARTPRAGARRVAPSATLTSPATRGRARRTQHSANVRGARTNEYDDTSGDAATMTRNVTTSADAMTCTSRSQLVSARAGMSSSAVANNRKPIATHGDGALG